MAYGSSFGRQNLAVANPARARMSKGQLPTFRGQPQTGGPGLSLQQGSPGNFASQLNPQPRAANSPMPQAANSPMPQAANSPTPQAHRWQDYDDTPKRDPRMPEFSLTGMQAAYEKGQQPESDPYIERIKQNQYANPGDSNKSDPYRMAPREANVDDDFMFKPMGGQNRGQPQTGGPGLSNPMPQAPSNRFSYKKGGSIKTKKGGSVKSSASKRGDGIAQRGKTRA